MSLKPIEIIPIRPLIYNGPFSIDIPVGSMVLIYMVTWIPSIYPIHVSIYSIHGSCGIYIYTSLIQLDGFHSSFQWIGFVEFVGTIFRIFRTSCFFTRFQGGFSICFRPIQLEIFRASQPATALATHLLETSGISRWVFCEANQWIFHCNL